MNVVAGSKDKLATHEMLLIAQEWGWMAGYSGRIYQNRMLIINIKLNAAERVLGVCCHRHFFIVGGLVFKLQTAFLSPDSNKNSPCPRCSLVDGRSSSSPPW